LLIAISQSVADVLLSGDTSAFIQSSLDAMKSLVEERDGWMRVIDVSPLQYSVEVRVMLLVA
jgi:hypothetical protein